MDASGYLESFQPYLLGNALDNPVTESSPSPFHSLMHFQSQDSSMAAARANASVLRLALGDIQRSINVRS